VTITRSVADVVDIGDGRTAPAIVGVG